MEGEGGRPQAERRGLRGGNTAHTMILKSGLQDYETMTFVV